ncbi:foldase protein PrsA [Planomicrobium koreense]|uniref:Foldase protein PrsA n=1 Tax=Planococcus koreensis TaxID=112331 RepID=A0A7W8CSK1_9BACL|nr:peptidylprolyl isomerase [Planococcus koreensis]MBB5179733.1 foldase protein PrsA [Planococcus koreensis]
MKKAIYIAIGVIAASAIFLLMSFGQNNGVASVNGKEISKDELYAQMLKTNGTETLDLMISEEIVRQEAEKEDITVSDEEIEAEIAVYEEQYGGAEELDSALAASGMTVESLKEEVQTYVKIEKLIGPGIEITDEQIQTYFDENKESLGQSEQVEASHILTATKEEAEEVQAKLAEGGDFAELAKEYSTDTASAENGGELGAFGAGEMAPAFEEAAFAMKVDDISKPVETEFGFHIIKVTGKTEAAAATLENSKEEIKELLFEEQLNSEYTTWLSKKQASYDIENTLSEGGN